MANDDAVRQTAEIPAPKPRTTRNPTSALPHAVPRSPYSPHTRASPRFSFPGSVVARNESPNPYGDARAH